MAMPYRDLVPCLLNPSAAASGVMGLPLFETAALLVEFGVPLWKLPAAVCEKDGAKP